MQQHPHIHTHTHMHGSQKFRTQTQVPSLQSHTRIHANALINHSNPNHSDLLIMEVFILGTHWQIGLLIFCINFLEIEKEN